MTRLVVIFAPTGRTHCHRCFEVIPKGAPRLDILGGFNVGTDHYCNRCGRHILNETIEKLGVIS